MSGLEVDTLEEIDTLDSLAEVVEVGDVEEEVGDV
jgi:hypothetical protein